MIKAGITGGIGAGKTTVCRIFETLGIPVFYADAEAKKILHNDRNVIHAVRAVFGEEVFTEGSPDRKKMAAVVFENAQKLQQLNSILHPSTFLKYEKWIAGMKDFPYTLLEAALIYESGAYKYLDKIIAVFSTPELRIGRIIRRDNISAQQVISIMKYQPKADIHRKKSDFSIINEGDQLLIPQVMRIHEQILSLIKN
ncbi:MAG: dephospho-CoA kinase [Chitinophagales bacterium]